MSKERRKILDMLSSGKINVDEAERLLAALSEGPETDASASKGTSRPKYLRVLVEPAPGNKKGDRINIRVPMNLIRAGLKWATLIPKHAQGKVDEALKEKGIDVDLNKITADDLEMLVSNLNDLQVEVEGEEMVRIYCE
jgi:hypothetical protein